MRLFCFYLIEKMDKEEENPQFNNPKTQQAMLMLREAILNPKNNAPSAEDASVKTPTKPKDPSRGI
jgi:hypothetical protein